VKLIVVNYNPKASFLVDALSLELEKIGVDFDQALGLSRDQIIDRVKDADILHVTPRTAVDAEMMDSLPNLRLLLAWGNGYEQIDLEAASERGIVVCNAGAYSNPDVAEMALTHIYTCGRKFLRHIRFLEQGRWQDRTDLHPIYRFEGRVVGLLGFGMIARELCWRLKGLRFEVQSTDPYVSSDVMSSFGVKKVGQEELFRTSDFVSLHLRVNEETTHIVNEETLRMMKPSAFLINVSRGALIDEQALVKAIEEGWIAGAGLDVLKHEPPDPDDPLLSLPNVTVTPHAGAGTEESKVEHVQEWMEVVKDLLAGKHPLHNQVNPAVKPRAD
jgi:D-3-phosphoglycerate dehydrogenase